MGGRWGAYARRGRVVAMLLALVFVLAACDFRVLSPARWGCGTHSYVVNPTRAPKGAVATVHEAFRQLNLASAPTVQWRYAGTTTADGARSGLVVVTWRPQNEVPGIMAPGAYGVGAPQPWPNNTKWTGGVVIIDPRYPVKLDVMLHEVGHVAGLGHVRDRNEVMYPLPTGKSHYMPGDLSGLRALALECK